ncbi:MAG TPA: hypothetical protein VFP93_05200 [Gammaproteobacteria bacterium]|nr:hypothetical protein [Gammaproteobacteria bacterium]
MKNVKEKISYYGKQIDIRSLRERFFIFLLFSILLYLLFQFLFFDPLLGALNRLSANVLEKKQTLEALHIQKELQEKKHTSQAQRLNHEIAIMRKKMENKKIALVPNTLMLTHLDTFFKHESALEVVEITNKEPERIESSKFYRHPIHIILLGTYFDLLSFITHLEKFTMPVLFESIQYEVGVYPKARVELVISLITMDEDFIKF